MYYIMYLPADSDKSERYKDWKKRLHLIQATDGIARRFRLPLAVGRAD